ncbi:MAG: protein kinase, partial [Polyangiaceae bacterium]|nr:protein kinase [Polyangiaceae bacterium]
MIVPGTILGSRYRIESHLGGGNMGDVYTARHTSTGRQFAVKVLRNHLVRNDLAREKFATEVQVGAVIGESHHIVEVSDAGFDAEHGVPYLVMPLLRGEALDAMIARGPL